MRISFQFVKRISAFYGGVGMTNPKIYLFESNNGLIYPKAEGSHGKQLRLNKGSAYFKCQKRKPRVKLMQS